MPATPCSRPSTPPQPVDDANLASLMRHQDRSCGRRHQVTWEDLENIDAAPQPEWDETPFPTPAEPYPYPFPTLWRPSLCMSYDMHVQSIIENLIENAHAHAMDAAYWQDVAHRLQQADWMASNKPQMIDSTTQTEATHSNAHTQTETTECPEMAGGHLIWSDVSETDPHETASTTSFDSWFNFA